MYFFVETCPVITGLPAGNPCKLSEMADVSPI